MALLRGDIMVERIAVVVDALKRQPRRDTALRGSARGIPESRHFLASRADLCFTFPEDCGRKAGWERLGGRGIPVEWKRRHNRLKSLKTVLEIAPLTS
jgi:hypothetical protein